MSSPHQPAPGGDVAVMLQPYEVAVPADAVTLHRGPAPATRGMATLDFLQRTRVADPRPTGNDGTVEFEWDRGTDFAFTVIWQAGVPMWASPHESIRRGGTVSLSLPVWVVPS